MSEIIITTPPAIYGEAVAGESASVRKELETLIEGTSKSQFDIAELLFTAKSKSFYVSWGFSTFSEFAKTLKLKESKSQYLVKMVEVMNAVGIPRSTYEPLGLTRLRVITSLDPKGEWTNPETLNKTSLADFIKGFVEKGDAISMDLLKTHTRTLKGIVGENDKTWRNLLFQREVAENEWDKAIELAKHNAGSAGKDSDGMSKDVSNEFAAQMLAVEYLNNPANNGSLVDTEEEADE